MSWMELEWDIYLGVRILYTDSTMAACILLLERASLELAYQILVCFH